MTDRILITAHGVPKPGGSKRMFTNRYTGKTYLTDDSGKAGKDWRGDVKTAAVIAMAGREPLADALRVTVLFWMPRPKSHYRKNGELKPTAPTYHTIRPDATKLWRSAEDAMTSIVWADDALIVKQEIEKMYGPKPGIDVVVEKVF